MSRIVVLDAAPVGLLAKASGHPLGDTCRSWVKGLEIAGTEVAIPEIARYEVRRELVRLGAARALERLDGLNLYLAFLPITSEIMDRASELWAEVRRKGLPTAGDAALDGDAILAAQALVAGGSGDDVLIATTNVAHLSRFPGVMALDWRLVV
jgi:predicted nucleic acid-binding protein